MVENQGLSPKGDLYIELNLKGDLTHTHTRCMLAFKQNDNHPGMNVYLCLQTYICLLLGLGKLVFCAGAIGHVFILVRLLVGLLPNVRLVLSINCKLNAVRVTQG